MPAPYKWDFVSVSYGFDVLEYWRAPCDATGCQSHAEASWRLMPAAVLKLRPLCPDHDNYR
jgi:hypothetical protein